MSSLVHVKGPNQAGLGERRRMLDKARHVFEETGLSTEAVRRVDVPAAGESASSGVGSAGTGHIRLEVEQVVPALQSGSMFMERIGVMMVDAQRLVTAERKAIAELLKHVDPEIIQVVIVSAGELPTTKGESPSFKRVVKELGRVIKISRLGAKDINEWLKDAASRRGITLSEPSQYALKDRFGSDLGAMDQALDQLAAADEPITPETIKARFQNRPDIPSWEYSGLIRKGDAGGAIDKLHNFMQHTHPLVLLAILESDIYSRAVAAESPNLKSFAERINKSASHYPTRTAWEEGQQLGSKNIFKIMKMLLRTDEMLKSTPEEMHMVEMERLTVALAKVYRRSSRSKR